MKSNPFLRLLLLLLPALTCKTVLSQTVTWNNQVFKIDTLYPASGTNGFNFPWEVTYGPDDSLWVTEARGYKVYKINPRNKGYRQIANLSSEINFAEGDGSTWPQGGLEGLAIHPDFKTGQRYVYLVYVYDRTGTCGNSICNFRSKVVRFLYPDTGSKKFTLCYGDTVLSNLPGSNDHNSGRLAIGPDNKLYYTIGDMGAGQFNNASRTNNAQNKNIYEGKVLRLNLEPDGDAADAADVYNEWIPNDNPFVHSVTGKRLAVFTYGHRNAQGLAWGNTNGTWRLYSSEHGDISDDEINILISGKNYGWPKVAGLCDNNYTTADGAGNSINNTLAGQTVTNEVAAFCNVTADNVQPMFSMFNWTGSQIQTILINPPKSTTDIFTWPTVAPSSLDFYGTYPQSIPGWNNSLLVTSLKYGLFRLKLRTSLGDRVDSASTPQTVDTIPYLHGNRIRDMAIAPTGDTLFFAIDKNGSTSGPTGGFSGGSVTTQNGGFILRMTYLSTLPLKDEIPPKPVNNRNYIRVFPNPASQVLYVQSKKGMHKPIRADIYTITGTLVLSQTSANDNFTVPINKLTRGTYVFKLYNAYNILYTTEKIIIQ